MLFCKPKKQHHIVFVNHIYCKSCIHDTCTSLQKRIEISYGNVFQVFTQLMNLRISFALQKSFKYNQTCLQ